MTPYEAKTINYLADEMKKLGLQPAFGNSFFQEVKTISAVCKPSGGKFKVKGSVSFVPSVAGLIIAGEVIKDIAGK